MVFLGYCFAFFFFFAENIALETRSKHDGPMYTQLVHQTTGSLTNNRLQV